MVMREAGWIFEEAQSSKCATYMRDQLVKGTAIRSSLTGSCTRSVKLQKFPYWLPASLKAACSNHNSGL